MTEGAVGFGLAVFDDLRVAGEQPFAVCVVVQIVVRSLRERDRHPDKTRRDALDVMTLRCNEDVGDVVAVWIDRNVAGDAVSRRFIDSLKQSVHVRFR